MYSKDNYIDLDARPCMITPVENLLNLIPFSCNPLIKIKNIIANPKLMIHVKFERSI
jgi:hypothetical protein